MFQAVHDREQLEALSRKNGCLLFSDTFRLLFAKNSKKI